MRILLLAAISALALTGPAVAKERPTGEAQLAKLLEGRVAGAPVQCIRETPSARTRTIDGTALVFGTGSLIYVNRTQDPRSLDDNDALIVRKYGIASQLCRTDIITTIDPVSKTYTGNVFLTEFVPYRRVR